MKQFWGGRIRNVFPKNCEVCGEIFYIPKHVFDESRYCSKACSYTGARKRFSINCSFCKELFVTVPSRRSKTGLSFCSRKCKEAAQSLRGGFTEIQPDHYGTGAPDYREIARKNLPPICNRCGYCEDVRMLDIHHMDSDRDNNLEVNLEVLCVMCHAKETRKDWPYQIWG